MYIDERIKKIILEEIKETGDINLRFLIPFFKESVLNFSINFPLDKYDDNYSLSDKEMDYLSSNVIKLLESNSALGLFKYVENNGKGYKWNDSLDLIDNHHHHLEILTLKENWIFNKTKTIYYIAEKEGASEIC